MNVTDATKEAYLDSSVKKELIITFPDLSLTVDMEHIIYESMTLKESIFESDSIEFVGCIASEFTVSLYGVTQDLKGQKIQVNIQAGDTEIIPLFYGIVDSVELEANHDKRKITCYDLLYKAGNVEVASWYNSLTFPITLGNLRNSLFAYIGLTQETITLPNDSISITKQYNPTTLQSISVIKAICQINGAFGIMNRQGKFEYRILAVIDDSSVPGSTLFPPFVPGSTGSSGERPSEYVPYYRKIDYQEYSVKPVDKLTIRQSDKEVGVSYGSGTNNYIIQGNMFAYNLDDTVRQQIAQNIYPNIQGIVYTPFESENDGLPWMECGIDNVSYYAYDYQQHDYVQKSFYVFARTLSGIQSLKDTYNADGEQDQKQFLTDLRTSIETVRNDVKDELEELLEDPEIIDPILDEYTYDKETIDEMIAGAGFKVESVAALPASPDPNTIYLIQGEVVVN